VLRYAFRLHRWGMVGYGVVLLASTVVQGAAYAQLTATPAGRAAFAHDMTLLAAQLSYLLPPPTGLDTLAGYVQWRAWGALQLVVAIWAIASAAGAVRGDEDRQLVDYWLASGVARARVLASRLAAFGLAGLVAVAGGAAGTLAGAARYESISVAGVAGKAIALWLLALALFALCLLVAQLVSSLRGAQVASAAVVVVLYLCDVLARTNHSFDGLSWVSPFRWYDASTPMAPGGHLDGIGVASSAAVVVGAVGLAALAFARRDVRGGLLARPARAARSRDVRPSPVLAWPVARLLYRQRWVLLGWTLITAVMALFMVSIARGSVDSLINLPGLRAVFTRGGSDPYQGFIATFWFSIAQLLLAGLAIHLVATWASDDNQGILTAELSTPRHRWGIVAERAVEAVLAVVLVVAAGSVVASATSAAQGTALDPAGVLRASWVLVPFGLTYAAVGATAVARWPRAVVGALGMLAFASFLIDEVAPFLSWPDWVANLSVFRLYGTPLVSGIYWNGLWAMVAVVLAGFALATVLMQRREVGS